MSMSKDQFLALCRREATEGEGYFDSSTFAEWIWDNLLYEGNASMKVKDYYEFMTDEEKAELRDLLARSEETARLARRERAIEIQMQRTGQDRATVERLLP